MFNRLFIIACSLFISLSSAAQDYEVLKKGSDLLLKEPLKIVFVGSDILAPIPLPYKDTFLLLTANSSGYSTTVVGSDYDLTSWTRTDALVFEGDFLDAYSGNEIFIQGKGINFSGGAKNGYITSSNAYVGETSHVHSDSFASASSNELTMIIIDGKAYLQFNDPSMAVVNYRKGEAYKVIPYDFSNTKNVSDTTQIKSPMSSVTPSGMFTSTYPIELPAGSGGTKPALAISYVGSSIKNGNLGYGFTLSGIETINVCTSNADPRNGHSVKTNLSTSESIQQLCYGGERLLSNDEDYISYYLINNPLISFERSNDEITQRYSNGDEKLYRLVNSLTYALVESSSMNGNKIVYSYSDTGKKVTQPKLNTITWGDYSVSLEYSNKRNDFDIKLATDGSEYYSNQYLLTDIEVIKSGSVLNSHHISYELLSGLNRYSVDSIQSCGHVPSEECFEKVDYKWSELSSFVGEQMKEGSEVRDAMIKAKLSEKSGDTLISHNNNIIKDFQGNILTTINSTYGKIVTINAVRKNGSDELLALLSKDTVENEGEWELIDANSGYHSNSNCRTGGGGGDDYFNDKPTSFDNCPQRYGPGNKCQLNNNAKDFFGSTSPKNQCFGPEYKSLAIRKRSYTWYNLIPDSNGTSLSEPELITYAGCYQAGVTLPDSFFQTAPYLNDGGMENGIPTSYLRVFSDTSVRPESSECISPDNVSNYAAGYLAYQGNDFSKGAYGLSLKGQVKTGITSIHRELNAGKVIPRYIYKNDSSWSSQSDIDGNGVLDEVSLVTVGDISHLYVDFIGPYKGTNFNSVDASTGNLPHKLVSVEMSSLIDSLLPYDLDHDGIKELLYIKDGSVNYLKIIYDPVNKKIVFSDYQLPKFQESDLSLATIKKLFLLDVNNDGRQELASHNVFTDGNGNHSLTVYELPAPPVLSNISYGNYLEAITYDESNVAISYDDDFVTTTVNDSIQGPVGYSLVSTFQRNFIKSGSPDIELVKKSYEYFKPLRHIEFGYSLGFGMVTVTDELTKNILETTYNQDALKKGLASSITKKIKVSGSYYTSGRIDHSYKRRGPFQKILYLGSSKTTSYIRGLASGVSTKFYNYNTDGHLSIVITLQQDANDLNLKVKYDIDGYEESASPSGGSYHLLTQQVAYIAIPDESPLVKSGYTPGTKKGRTQYIESSTLPGTIGEIKTGYSDNLDFDNLDFTELSSQKVILSEEDNGNPSQVIKTGFAASTAAANDTLVFASYDGANPTEITHQFGGNEFGTSNYGYDALGRLLSEKTVEGNTTSYTYDAFGRVKTLTTTRDSATYSYLSCADSGACSGLIPSVIADEIVWMNSVSWTSGKIERSFVDAHGRNVATSWNNELDQTLFAWKVFDTKGRLSREYLPCKLGTCSAASPHTLYEYEANANDIWQTKKTLADGTVVKNTIKTGSCYDVFGSLDICKNSAGEIVTPLYITETIIDGNQPLLGDHNSPLAMAQAAITHKSYQVIDPVGQVFASVEGAGDDSRAVVFSRNILGDITQVHHRVGDGTNTQLVRSYEYLSSGLLKTDTNAVGVKEVYAYNSAGIIDNTYSFGADAKLYGTNSYDFDVYGRLKASYENHSDEGTAIETSPEDGSYTYPSTTFNKPRSHIYSYDSASITEGRPAGYVCNKYYPCAEKSSSNGIDSIKHFNFTADGLLEKKIEIIKGDGETRNASFAYGYSTYGDLQSETLSGTGLTSYGLIYTNHNRGTTTITDSSDEILWQLTATDNKGAPSSISILGGSETLFDTDSLGREVTRSTVDGTSNTISNWNQGYNHLGTNAYRQSGVGTAQAENFQYDAFGQIDNTEIDSTQPYDFNIDSLANLTALRGANITRSTLDTGCATNTNVAGANLRTGSSPWIVSGNDQVVGSYCYDQMGRQLINGENTIEYFANGQAASIKNATAEISLAYDASGTPIHEKQTSSIAGKNYSAWLFDGARVEQRNDNGVLSTRFYPINNLRISFASNSSTPIYDFVMTDTLGSTTGLARKSGDQLIVDPAKTRGYTPYGSQRNPNDWDSVQGNGSDIDIGDAYGFTGQRYLSEFGLYQYVGRIYDPKLGSFTGPDPIVAGEGNWKAYNPYTYVFNDPLGLVDPSGYEPVSDCSSDIGGGGMIYQICTITDDGSGGLGTRYSYDGNNYANTQFNNLTNLADSQFNYVLFLANNPDPSFDLIIPSQPGFLEVGGTFDQWNALQKQNYSDHFGEVAGGALYDYSDPFTPAVDTYREVSAGNIELYQAAGFLAASYGAKKFGAVGDIGKKFWNKSTNFRGIKVFQRNDLIDTGLLDKRGRTNLQRMSKGLAPIGPDGKSINLHHLTQRNDGTVAEMTQTFHQENSKRIHINPSSIPSGIDRKEFRRWKKAYWKLRSASF